MVVSSHGGMCDRGIEGSQREGEIRVEFPELDAQSSKLQEQFGYVLKVCCGKSELCQYLQLFQHISAIIKHVVASYRE